MASSSSADPTPVPAPAPRRRRRLIAGAAAAALLTAVAVTAVLLAPSGRDETPRETRYRPADRSFSIALPAGWKALSSRQLDDVPSAPAAVLRRSDRRGLVVIRRQAALDRNSRSLTQDLTRQLRRHFRGLRPVGARTVQLRSGPGYVYTFARPSAGTVQSIAVAPLPDRTYTLDAVTGAESRDVAVQIGAIVRSFDASAPDITPSP
jgi:hypothetical protein